MGGIDIIGEIINENKDKNKEKKKYFDSNLEIVREKLKGITWITKNPGRQWTSSINPAIVDPEEFYGTYYTYFNIGIEPNVESLIRLARTKKGNVWYMMPKGVLGIIFKFVFLYEENKFKQSRYVTINI